MSMDRPNILLFLADQHRYDCVGNSHKYPVKTPCIDKLGEEGAIFDCAFSPTPVCAPARQSFLSGSRAESMGAIWNFNFIPTNTIKPTDWNFTTELAKTGYTNVFIGAWDASVYEAEKFGFHRVHSSRDYNAFLKERYPEIKYLNSWFGEECLLPLIDTRVNFFADKACNEIDKLKNDKDPWFIWVDGVDPHLPCRPSSPFFEMYDPKEIPVWEGFSDTFENKPYIQKQQLLNWRLEDKTWEDWSSTVACYYGMISQVDNAFGRIMDTLKKSGQEENTLVIYTSDHGDMCGSHGMIDKHYVLYDDLLHIPMIMKLPKVIKPGRRIDKFVHNALDLAPTICELCGLDPYDKWHGRSLVPLLDNSKMTDSTAPFEDFIVSSQNGQQFGSFTQRCIRTRTHKYIWNLTDKDEFYDLSLDPGELHNMIYDPRYTDMISSLRKQLKKELMRCKDPFVKGGWLNRQLDENVKL